MNIDEIKYMGASIIFVVCIIFAILPNYVKSNSWVSRFDALAGGVFIGAALVHLYPEGMHELENFDFPLYAYIAISGFFLMLLIGIFAGDDSHKNEHSDGFQSQKDTLSMEIIQDSEPENKNKAIQPTTKALYAALMFHSFVEAVAFGVVTEKASCLSLLFVLLGHKPVEVFALGLAVLKSNPTKLMYFLMMGIFSLAAPVTTIVFHFIGKSLGELFGGIVTALSAGVFIYIGLHEISEMMENFHDFMVREKCWHLGFLFIGLLWMSLMGLVGEHDHHE